MSSAFQCSALSTRPPCQLACFCLHLKQHRDTVSVFGWVYKFLSFLGSKDYQLVTWSRDQTLRMWRVDSQLQRVRKHLNCKQFSYRLGSPPFHYAPSHSSGILRLQTQQQAATSVPPSAPVQMWWETSPGRPVLRPLCVCACVRACKATLSCSSKHARLWGGWRAVTAQLPLKMPPLLLPDNSWHSRYRILGIR